MCIIPAENLRLSLSHIIFVRNAHSLFIARIYFLYFILQEASLERFEDNYLMRLSICGFVDRDAKIRDIVMRTRCLLRIVITYTSTERLLFSDCYCVIDLTVLYT